VDENRDTLNSHGDVCTRWRHYFLIVLNVHSSIQEEAVNSVVQFTVRDHLDDVPSCEEVQLAIDHLKNCKAAGESGLLLKLLMCGGSVIVEKLVELFDSMWRDGCAVRDWCNALIVQIPKKGNLKVCDNWRGISLLEVVGKILGRVVQDRLKSITEEALSVGSELVEDVQIRSLLLGN